MEYRCKKCGLEFNHDEITAEDEQGRDLCPACGKPLNERDNTMEETNRICGIIIEHGNNDFGLWEEFNLSEEDENAIWNILLKYDTEGCSVRGTRKEIAEEIGG